jgi:hypothetical protein
MHAGATDGQNLARFRKRETVPLVGWLRQKHSSVQAIGSSRTPTVRIRLSDSAILDIVQFGEHLARE